MNPILPLSKEDFRLFQRLLVETSGLYFTPDKNQHLQSALWQRIQQRGHDSYGEYYRFLKYHPEGRIELKDLFDLITIGETYFFRNKAQFEVLQKFVLPDIVRRSLSCGDKSIRVWSAGCSGGDEAYSIAIAIMESVPSCESWNISILGTDINRNELRRAREGIYGERAVSQLPKEYLEKYFEIQGTHFLLKAHVRELVQFEYHNLACDPYLHEKMREVDLLFCRNVIIYFDDQTTQRVIDHFYNCLAPHGYLFLGHTETLWQITNHFERVEFPQAFIYQKRVHPIPANDSLPFLAVPEIKFTNFTPSLETFKSSPFEEGMESTTQGASVSNVKEIDTEGQERGDNASSPILPGAQDEDDHQALLSQAVAMANEEKYQEALNILKKVIEVGHLNMEAHYLIGVLYYKIKELREAEAHFRKVIYLDRDSVLAFYHLGNIYLFQKRLTEAAREFKNAIRLIKKRPKDEPIRFGEDFPSDWLLKACENNLREISQKRGGRHG